MMLWDTVEFVSADLLRQKIKLRKPIYDYIWQLTHPKHMRSKLTIEHAGLEEGTQQITLVSIHWQFTFMSQVFQSHNSGKIATTSAAATAWDWLQVENLAENWFFSFIWCILNWRYFYLKAVGQKTITGIVFFPYGSRIEWLGSVNDVFKKMFVVFLRVDYTFCSFLYIECVYTKYAIWFNNNNVLVDMQILHVLSEWLLDNATIDGFYVCI